MNNYKCLQKVDAIIQARKLAFANLHLKEDRLVAIQILATYWRNQRKMYKKKVKDLASAETGMRMSYKLLHVANLYRMLLQK